MPTEKPVTVTLCGQEHAAYECACPCPHYPLHFFAKDIYVVATRGTLPVQNILADGWQFADPSPRVRRDLRAAYDRSHRFDWLHTPTYLDDRETHLRMKVETAR